MLVNRRDRRQPEALADLFETGCVAGALEVLADEIEDLFLPLGEVHANSHDPRISAESTLSGDRPVKIRELGA